MSMGGRRALLRMAQDSDNEGPPESPRSDGDDVHGSAARTADVRLNKDAVAYANAENDKAQAELSLVNLLRSVPTPRLLALEQRALLPENKALPQSQFLLRDIHWEKQRRGRWKHRETRKARMDASGHGIQGNTGLYRTTVVPKLDIDPVRAAVHLQGRHVVGRRKVPLVDELHAWRQSEIAASRARAAAEKAAEVQRQAEFEAAKQELQEEIEEMKRKAARETARQMKKGKASGGGDTPVELSPEERKAKRRALREKKRAAKLAATAAAEAAAALAAAESGGANQANNDDPDAAMTEQERAAQAQLAAQRDAAAAAIKANKVTIPRTPDGVKLRPWFHYVKSLRQETQRQSSLLRPTEQHLAEAVEALAKLEGELKASRARVRRLDTDLTTQQQENRVVVEQAKVVREKTGIRIRELDSECRRLEAAKAKAEAEAERREKALVDQLDKKTRSAKQKVLELTGELIALRREAKGANSSNESLQEELGKHLARAEALAGKVSSLERQLKESKSAHGFTEAKLAEARAALADSEVSISARDGDIAALREELQQARAQAKEAARRAKLREKDLLRQQRQTEERCKTQLAEQSTAFARDSRLMKVKVSQVELVMGDADARHQASDKAVRSQLKTERQEREDRERNHAKQLQLERARTEELRAEAARSAEERALFEARARQREAELEKNLAAFEADARQKRDLLQAELEAIIQEKDEIISSKERQLRTVRGKLTVVKARVSDMNSQHMALAEAEANELLRLQAWSKTLEGRLADAETAREQEAATLRARADTLEAQARDAADAARIQIQLARDEATQSRKQLREADARLADFAAQADAAAAEAEATRVQLVAENDAAGARAAELVNRFQKQELAFKANEVALRRRQEQLEGEKSDALKLKNFHAVDEELMEVRAALADARAEVQRAALDEARAKNERAEAAAKLVLLQDKYDADVADRNNTISRINRDQEGLESGALKARNAAEVAEKARVELQAQLDETNFQLRQLRASAGGEKARLEEELKMAEQSIRSLQTQNEALLTGK